MSDKTEALYDFFSGFGLPAYEESSVPPAPNTPQYPYLTYSMALDGFGGEVPIHASLWYRDSSWLSAEEKASLISSAVGLGGTVIPCNGGAIWIKRGSPFVQSVSDSSDELMKHIYLNFTLEFFTPD